MPDSNEMRQLIAELRGSAGLGASGRGGGNLLEVFMLMPDEFRRAYQLLTSEALKPGVDDSQGRRNERDAALGKARGGRSGQTRVSGGGKKFRADWTVRNERALEAKLRIDRQLRKLGREMRDALEDLSLDE